MDDQAFRPTSRVFFLSLVIHYEPVLSLSSLSFPLVPVLLAVLPKSLDPFVRDIC